MFIFVLVYYRHSVNSVSLAALNDWVIVNDGLKWLSVLMYCPVTSLE